jgi:hypothetical protein
MQGEATKVTVVGSGLVTSAFVALEPVASIRV